MSTFTARKIIGPESRGVGHYENLMARGLFGMEHTSGRARRFFGPGNWRQVFAINASDLPFPARLTVKAPTKGARVGILFDRGQVPGGNPPVDCGDGENVVTIEQPRPVGEVLEVWATDDVEVMPLFAGDMDTKARGIDGDNSNEIAAILRAAEVQLDLLNDERQRIAGEAATMGFFEDGLIGLALGFEVRAASTLSLIEAIENFVSNVYVRVEAKAKAGDLAAARRLERATRNILAAVRGVTPFQDLEDDVVKFVKDTADDAEDAVKIGTPIIVLALVAIAVIVIALR